MIQLKACFLIVPGQRGGEGEEGEAGGGEEAEEQPEEAIEEEGGVDERSEMENICKINLPMPIDFWLGWGRCLKSVAKVLLPGNFIDCFMLFCEVVWGGGG